MVGNDEVVVEVRDLGMRYGTTEVLSGIGFTVRCGEVVTLQIGRAHV